MDDIQALENVSDVINVQSSISQVSITKTQYQTRQARTRYKMNGYN